MENGHVRITYPRSLLCLSKTRNDVSQQNLYFSRISFLMPFLVAFLIALRSLLRSRVDLQLEILALRQQIGVLQRSVKKRPKLRSTDRLFWVALSRVWQNWRATLVFVKPETVLAWHRQGFRWFWIWKVRRGQRGRPLISRDVRDLIRKMCGENPTWGAPRIHGPIRSQDDSGLE